MYDNEKKRIKETIHDSVFGIIERHGLWENAHENMDSQQLTILYLLNRWNNFKIHVLQY